MPCKSEGAQASTRTISHLMESGGMLTQKILEFLTPGECFWGLLTVVLRFFFIVIIYIRHIKYAYEGISPLPQSSKVGWGWISSLLYPPPISPPICLCKWHHFLFVTPRACARGKAIGFVCRLSSLSSS